jgi:hypothetical protein
VPASFSNYRADFAVLRRRLPHSPPMVIGIGTLSRPPRSAGNTGEDQPRLHERMLRLTLLAPDIVEAILDGRRPAELQLDDLLEGLPLGWKEQREAVVDCTLLRQSLEVRYSQAQAYAGRHQRIEGPSLGASWALGRAPRAPTAPEHRFGCKAVDRGITRESPVLVGCKPSSVIH